MFIWRWRLNGSDRAAFTDIHLPIFFQPGVYIATFPAAKAKIAFPFTIYPKGWCSIIMKRAVPEEPTVRFFDRLSQIIFNELDQIEKQGLPRKV